MKSLACLFVVTFVLSSIACGGTTGGGGGGGGTSDSNAGGGGQQQGPGPNQFACSDEPDEGPAFCNLGTEYCVRQDMAVSSAFTCEAIPSTCDAEDLCSCEAVFGDCDTGDENSGRCDGKASEGFTVTCYG